MHREKLLKLVDKYIPQCKMQKEAKLNLINFVNSNPNCFDRNLEAGHITGSAWLLNKQGDKALLMHHAKLNKWLQLGGHADGDSDIISVAIKEAKEESGISSIHLIYSDIFDIDIHLIPENLIEKTHYHYDIRFLLQVKSEEELKQNIESKDLKWLSFNEVSNFTQEESVLRMNRKWQKLFIENAHILKSF